MSSELFRYHFSVLWSTWSALHKTVNITFLFQISCSYRKVNRYYQVRYTYSFQVISYKSRDTWKTSAIICKIWSLSYSSEFSFRTRVRGNYFSGESIINSLEWCISFSFKQLFCDKEILIHRSISEPYVTTSIIP